MMTQQYNPFVKLWEMKMMRCFYDKVSGQTLFQAEWIYFPVGAAEMAKDAVGWLCLIVWLKWAKFIFD